LILVPTRWISAWPPTGPAATCSRWASCAQAARLTHWVAENAKTTRAFLKRVDAIVPLAQPLQSLSIVELPRPQKGDGSSRSPAGPQAPAAAGPARARHRLDLRSGPAGHSRPGRRLVQAAHHLGVEVLPLSGPSSLLLALAASGLNGQSFAFVGYLPVDAGERGQRIRELETLSKRSPADAIDDRDTLSQRSAAVGAADAPARGHLAVSQLRPDAAQRLDPHRTVSAWKTAPPSACRTTSRRCFRCWRG
jgi:16S rRNA (cytidine1402-2'-O)-methyltransferase